MRKIIHAGVGPVYARIQRLFREKIENFEYKPGSFLPPESELARELGVSVGTIKKALVGLAAEGLIERRRGQGTRVLGPVERNGSRRRPILVLIGTVKRTFFAEIFEGIQSVLIPNGCQPLLHDNMDHAEREREILEEFASIVEGAIVAPYPPANNHSAFARFLDAGVPLVFVDRYLPRLNMDAAVSDNVQGGFLAARHLIELGHRNIAVLNHLHGAVSVRERLEGYRKALAEAGLPAKPEWICHLEETGYDAAYAATGRLLAEHPEITAIFAPRDDEAWGVLQRIQDMGGRVPEDISIIGFGDESLLGERLRPRLTTIRQDNRALGQAAAQLLLERMGSKDKTASPHPVAETARIVTLPVALIVRESTSAPRTGPLVYRETRFPIAESRMQPVAAETVPSGGTS